MLNRKLQRVPQNHRFQTFGNQYSGKRGWIEIFVM